MTLEEALISLGSQPLSKSQYSQAIYSIVKASVGAPGEQITKDTLGHQILGIIYQMPNVKCRKELLTRKLGRVRNADIYKQVVVASAVVLVMVVVVVSLIEVLSEAPVSGDYADVLKTAVISFFEVLKMLINEPQTTAPSV